MYIQDELIYKNILIYILIKTYTHTHQKPIHIRHLLEVGKT